MATHGPSGTKATVTVLPSSTTTMANGNYFQVISMQ